MAHSQLYPTLQTHDWKQVLPFHWLNHLNMQHTDICIKIIFFFSCASAFFSHVCSTEFWVFFLIIITLRGLLEHKWPKANKRASGSSLSATFIEMWQLVLYRNENYCWLSRYLIGIFAPAVFELWIFAVSIFPTEITYAARMKIHHGIQILCSC